MGQHTLAINDFSNSFEMNPLNVKTFINRGTAHAKAGNYGDAVDDYNQALKFDPTNANAMHNRAVALTKMGRFEAAVEGFSQLIRAYPRNANAYFCRGSAYVPFARSGIAQPLILLRIMHFDYRLDALGEYEHAVEDYTRALNLEGSVDSSR